MSHQNALDACSKADLVALKETLSDPSAEVDNNFVCKLLIIAIQNKNSDIVEWLLDTYSIPRLDKVVWHIAAVHAGVKIIDLLLAKYPSCITDMFERHGRGTILGIALYAAQPKEFIQHLLDVGADVSGVNAFTPLGIAAGAYETPEVMELLLRHGAEVKHSAALAQAANHGRTANVKYLFAHGADINDPGKGTLPYLPLHTAVQKADVDMVRSLLCESPNKADLTLVDHEGKTVWDLAQDNEDIVKLLNGAQN